MEVILIIAMFTLVISNLVLDLYYVTIKSREIDKLEIAVKEIESELENLRDSDQFAEELERIIIDALEQDGVFHKQWYLEQIAKKLAIDLSRVDYEKGIAP